MIDLKRNIDLSKKLDDNIEDDKSKVIMNQIIHNIIRSETSSIMKYNGLNAESLIFEYGVEEIKSELNEMINNIEEKNKDIEVNHKINKKNGYTEIFLQVSGNSIYSYRLKINNW